MSEEGLFLLNACKKSTGYTDTKVMELCIAMHALGLGLEVRKAHEFLYANLVESVQNQKLAEQFRPVTKEDAPIKPLEN